MAEPKDVAGRPASLPAQQAAADPLQSYCPDLDQWPSSWAYEKRDIPCGLRIVECFTPFLREMLARSLSRKTLRQHRDNIWVLGGEVIRRVQMDSGSPHAAGRAGRPRPHRRRRRAATFPWPVRNRATFLRRNLPQALSLPDRPPDQPPPQRSKLYRDDEPIASLTAPMQNSRPCRSRSSPAAAKRCAAGAGLDGDPLGRGTIGCAVR
jgi:hypothetical protein